MRKDPRFGPGGPVLHLSFDNLGLGLSIGHLGIEVCSLLLNIYLTIRPPSCCPGHSTHGDYVEILGDE